MARRSLRERVREALDEAEAKANAMSQEELDARLGPATRAVFAAGERIEKGGWRVHQGAVLAGSVLLGNIALFVAGWMMGSAGATMLPPGTGARILAFVAVLALAGGAVAALRRKGADVGYLGGLFGFLAASAGSGGGMEGALLGMALWMGAGAASLLVAIPDSATADPSAPSVDTPT